MMKTKTTPIEMLVGLKQSGLTYAAVADALNGDGYGNSRGKPWTGSAVDQAIRRHRAEQSAPQPVTEPEQAIPSEITEESDTPVEPELSDQSETGAVTPDAFDAETSAATETHEDPTPAAISSIASDRSDITDTIPEAWRPQILQMIQTAMETMKTDQTIQIDQTPAMGPAPTPGDRVPGGKGKPVNPGKRVKIAGTVDAVLEKHVRRWMKKQGATLSHVLDAALWHFFGKPPLSFEITETSDNIEQGSE
jgi:hypothetical protein